MSPIPLIKNHLNPLKKTFHPIKKNPICRYRKNKEFVYRARATIPTAPTIAEREKVRVLPALPVPEAAAPVSVPVPASASVPVAAESPVGLASELPEPLPEPEPAVAEGSK